MKTMQPAGRCPARALGITLLFAAVTVANATPICFNFLGSDPDTSLDGLDVLVSSVDGNVHRSSTQGYGVITPGDAGAALGPGESIDFAFSMGGLATDVTLTQISFWLANTGEEFSVALSSDGLFPAFYSFPSGTDPNASTAFDVSTEGFYGSSFRVTNVMMDNGAGTDSPNFRISGICVDTAKSVPDGGATLALLGVSLGGVLALRRRFS